MYTLFILLTSFGAKTFLSTDLSFNLLIFASALLLSYIYQIDSLGSLVEEFDALLLVAFFCHTRLEISRMRTGTCVHLGVVLRQARHMYTMASSPQFLYTSMHV